MLPQIKKWMPALLMMAAIFAFSAQPGDDLPDFNAFDRLVKKGGHAFGYGLLALAYWRGLEMKPGWQWLAWLMAVTFSASDEFHQSFVSGRHASVWDVVLYDNLGALAALFLFSIHRSKYEKNNPARLP